MTTTTVKKRNCPHGEKRWLKCDCPWYMKKFIWQGKLYADNLTRYAKEILHEDLTAKTRAEQIAAAIQTAIRAGQHTSAKARRQARPPEVTVTAQTVAQAITAFDEAVIKTNPNTRPKTKCDNRGNLDAFAAFRPDKRPPVGEWDLQDLTIETISAFRNSPAIVVLANSTWNKYRGILAAFTEWSTRRKLMLTDPFAALGPEDARTLKRKRAVSRRRRVSVGEEANLLWAAGRAGRTTKGEQPAAIRLRLQGLIVAAVETGMRKGELLALQWADVDLDARTIFVRAREVGGSKTGKTRMLPISQRLISELPALRLDPNGDVFGRSAYVFGDAIGGKLKSFRTAWETMVLRAHGHTPIWVRRGAALHPTSTAKLTQIDLHFHDLRHEAGCRWLESKVWDLEQIRQMYGHASVAQTADYLHAATTSTLTAMQAFDAQRGDAGRKAAAVSQSGYKPGTNAGAGSRAKGGPRLVKGEKSRDGK